ERRFRLKTDDDFVLAVNVSRCVRRDRTRYLGNVEHTLPLAFLEEHRLQLLPDALRAFSRRCQESTVAVVRRVVLLEEPAHIDVALPQAGLEPAPGLFRVCRVGLSSFGFGR